MVNFSIQNALISVNYYTIVTKEEEKRMLEETPTTIL